MSIRAGQSGANLILLGRNKAKGEKLIEGIIWETGSENLYSYNADFLSLQQVQELNLKVITNHQQLHVLINNAAIGGGQMVVVSGS